MEGVGREYGSERDVSTMWIEAVNPHISKEADLILLKNRPFFLRVTSGQTEEQLKPLEIFRSTELAEV